MTDAPDCVLTRPDGRGPRTRARGPSCGWQTEVLRLGFRRPERAHREVDLAEVRYDEEGHPTNLRELLETDLKARPELRTVTPALPDAGAGERGRTSALTHDQVRQRARENPGFVREHWDEIREVLGRPGR